MSQNQNQIDIGFTVVAKAFEGDDEYWRKLLVLRLEGSGILEEDETKALFAKLVKEQLLRDGWEKETVPGYSYVDYPYVSEQVLDLCVVTQSGGMDI